ncbi:MAG: PspC domain-containing protein, partial [Flavobacteriales bacterium]|nr:PspC domain-containing protein [Flavobacteriales bacterium]
EGTEAYGATDEGHSYRRRKARRLFRDPDDKVLGGVCSGIGAYFDLDPLWFRLAFAASFLLFGSGFLFYILLWMIVPEASTTAEKLEMKGEKVNISNIEKTIRDEMDNLKKRFQGSDGKHERQADKDRSGNFFERFFSAIGQLILGVLRLGGKFIGVVLTFFGIFLLIFFIASLFGSDVFFGWHSDDVRCGIEGMEWIDIQRTFLPASWQFPIGIISLILVVCIPIMGLLLAGVRLLFGVRTGTRGMGLILSALWAAGVIMGLVLISRTSLEFKHETDSREMIPVATHGDTLYLDVNRDHFKTTTYDRYHPDYLEFVEIGDGKVYMGALRLDIRRSMTDSVSVEIIKSAHGRTRGEAEMHTDDIRYAFSIRDSLILFDPFFTFSRETPWRVQQAEVIVWIPEGMVIDLSQRMDRILYDVDNTTDTYDRKMVGHQWKMTRDGLECITCEKRYENRSRDIITDVDVEMNGEQKIRAI